MTSSDKLDLLGMLWYHGLKSKKEAEAALEACPGDCCYIVRETRGTHYLSASYRGMFYHLPISHTHKDGYILEGHYNAFRTLQELVSHHQKHEVYVDGGEFILRVSCHKDFTALTGSYIREYFGSCTIRVREDSIVIMKSDGTEIGTWAYIFIREFRFEDEKHQFTFKSGRRGPFGVQDYIFKLHNRVYYNLRETVNKIAAGCGGGEKNGVKESPQEFKPPVPQRGHRRSSDFALMQQQSEKEHVYNDIPAIKSIGQQRSVSIPDLFTDFPSDTPQKYGGSPPTSSKKRSGNLPHPPKRTVHKVENHLPLSHSVKVSPTHEAESQIHRSSSDPHSKSLKESREARTRYITEHFNRALNFSTEGKNGVSLSEVPTILSSENNGINILSEEDEAKDESHDYQKPRPAKSVDYSIPISANDPRNDYQVPRPMEETYMVPRPVAQVDPKSSHGVMQIPRVSPHRDSPLLTRKVSNELEHSYEDLDGYMARAT